MLRLFRRHTKSCLATLADKHLSEAELRNWKRCRCPIHYTGTFQNVPHRRKSLGVNTWAEAENALQRIQEEQLLGTAAALPISDAVDKWLEDRKVTGLAPGTLEKYRRIGRSLMDFAKRRRLKHLQAVTPDHIEDLKAEWVRDLAKSTAASNLNCLSGLFSVAHRRGWISANPVKRVERLRVLPSDVVPFTSEEIERLYASVPKVLGKGRISRLARHPETFTALLKFLRATGLRISDALQFDPAVAEKRPNGMWCYELKQMKNQRPVTCLLSDDFMCEIRSVPWVCYRLPFWDGHTLLKYARCSVEAWLRAVGKHAKVPDTHPHRFRHTFAVESLNRGVPIEYVSRLLGHSSVTITEKHYAKWVKSRLDAMAQAVLKSMDY